MPTIFRLPADLANQIAAGEVVERPASVVKELVENAIDAGARRVSIHIEFGGKKLVRVEDDGDGMSRDDAELALERHATSKIRTAADLAAIRTLGFRGEALPSIASVSHLTLRSRARGTASGTEIRIDAGMAVSIREIGAAEGTTIDVADLFYNLPARRKFLKADTAESTQVSRIVTQIALAYPGIGFTLTSAGRQLLEVPPVADLPARFHQIYGDRTDLVEVRRETGGIELFGFVAALGEQGAPRGPQHVFVNGRAVKDRTIAHAIVAAYSVATIKERSPEVHLFITMPPDRVDVNVHPAKAEVRFLDSSLVHELLRRAIGDAIGRGPGPGLQFQLAAGVADVMARNQDLPNVFSGIGSGAGWLPAGGGPVERGANVTGLPETTAARSGADTAPGGATGVRPMVPLGQFRDTYIIAVDDEGVAIVDQHVAHERVLFEQVLERLASGRLASQRLLQPVVLELSPAQRGSLASHREDLERLGFEVEEFGGSSVRIGAVPSLLGGGDAIAAVRALANDLEDMDRGARVDDALRRVAATMACHAAVKANDPLTFEKMRYILDELRRTAYSTVCPHGRPVVLRLTRREIEKNFQRI